MDHMSEAMSQLMQHHPIRPFYLELEAHGRAAKLHHFLQGRNPRGAVPAGGIAASIHGAQLRAGVLAHIAAHAGGAGNVTVVQHDQMAVGG